MIEAFRQFVKNRVTHKDQARETFLSSILRFFLQETEMLENASRLTLTFGPFARCVLPTLQILS